MSATNTKTKVPPAIASGTSGTTRRAGVYKRISQDKTGQAAGVTRQDKDARELAGRLGWDVVDTYTDNDISAYSGRRRPEYERLKADLEAGRIDAVVAWHPDRLYRRAKELEAFVDLVQAVGAEVATVQAGAVDLATPNGRLVARIGAAVAQHESEHKAERVARWHQDRAEAGQPNGGRRPYGFLPDRVGHDPVESELVREAAARVLAGESFHAIVLDFERRGVTTVTGARWSSTALAGVLRSPRIAGLREHHGKLHQAVWEPILDRPTWDALRALGAGRRRPGRPLEYVLSRVARCALCGCGMTGNRTRHNERSYRCPPGHANGRGCGKVGRNAAALEDHVAALVIDALAGPALAKALEEQAGLEDTLAGPAAVLETLDRRLERLKHEYAVEDIWTKAEFLTQKAELESRRAEVAATIQPARRHIPGLPSDKAALTKWWETASKDDRRAVIALVVDHVVVHPVGKAAGHKFNPDKVEIIWKA